jgi:hypothetical protein
MRRIQRRRAATVAELIIYSALMVIVVGGTVATLVFGSATWLRGGARVDSETNSQRAVRLIGEELRQAMAVSVDNDNNGLTYRLPQTDVSGSYVAPPIWDNVTRRIYRSNGQIFLQSGATLRVIASGVRTVDPNTNAAYTLFTPGLGTVTRSITVNVATERLGDYNRPVTSRYREVVFLRNIPDLFR